MKASYSAPAKVILSGEHGVVYGKPALVSAIDLRLTVTVPGESRNPVDEHIEFIIKTVKEYLHKKNVPFEEKTVNLSISSSIPVGRGLGSSAALSVASAAALMHYLTGRKFEKEEINSVAYIVEKHFHKNPSGVDVSASCFGGLIFFRKEFEFLKQISALTVKIPKHIEESLYLIDSGKPKESTGDMVETVGKTFKEDLFIQMEKITKRMVVSFVKEDKEFFKQCLEENETLLEKLGIVSDSTQLLLQTLKQFGAGKVTGAGGKKEGSGYILFYCENHHGLEKYLTSHKISFMKFKQDYEGLKHIS